MIDVKAVTHPLDAGATLGTPCSYQERCSYWNNPHPLQNSLECPTNTEIIGAHSSVRSEVWAPLQ
eukprot:2875578-Rhodomonas_salina.2